MTVLSTKKLSPTQKNLLLNTGLSLVEYDAINIDFLDFHFESETIKNAVITSKNAAKAVVKKGIKLQNCFCVGEKTAIFLKENNFNIAAQENYGKDLAKKIISEYAEEYFTFFCGNLRRDEIPSTLTKHGVKFKEVEVYKTLLNLQKFQQEFNGILFFSPSAVESFAIKNNFRNSTSFCIGTTTAKEAKKYTNNIKTATKPSIENVIVQVVNFYKEKN